MYLILPKNVSIVQILFRLKNLEHASNRPTLTARSDRYKCSILPNIKHLWNPGCLFLYHANLEESIAILKVWHSSPCILYNTNSRKGWVSISWFPLSQNWVNFSPSLKCHCFLPSSQGKVYIPSQYILYAYVLHVFFLSVCMSFGQCWFLATSWTSPCSFIGKFHKCHYLLPKAEKQWLVQGHPLALFLTWD